MTREEAKEIFLNRGYVDGIYHPDKWRDACVVISKWLEQDSCKKDEISRQAVIDLLQSLLDKSMIEFFTDKVKKLPSVTPTVETAEWNEKSRMGDWKDYLQCSRCDYSTYDEEKEDCTEFLNYCPNCGRK